MEVILLTNDRPEFLTITLQSIALQAKKGRGRLVVLDDGLTPAMASAAVRKMFDFASHIGWAVEYHRNHNHKGVTYVRHVAAALAREDYFCMVDGDVLIPHPSTLVSLVNAAKTKDAAFAVPRLLNIDNQHGAWHDPFAKSDNIEQRESLQWANPSTPSDVPLHCGHGATACIAFDRRRFESAGGFSFYDKINEGEEVLISERLGNNGILLQNFPVYHFGNQWTIEGLQRRLDDTKRKLVEAIK